MPIGDENWNEDEYQKEVKALRDLRAEATNWYKDIDGVSRKARQEQIELINKEIDQYKSLSKGTGRLAEQAKVLLDLKQKQLAVAKQQTQVLGRLQQEANVTYRGFLNFLTQPPHNIITHNKLLENICQYLGILMVLVEKLDKNKLN